MGKNVSPALKALIENANTAKKGGVFASVNALAGRAGVNDKTIGRMLKGDNEPSLDTVSAVAKALGMEPWQLIRPERSHPPKLTIPAALDALIEVAGQLPPAERKELADAASLLSQVPDSAELRLRVLNALLRQATPEIGRRPDKSSGELPDPQEKAA